MCTGTSPNLIENEKIKYKATFYNTVSAGSTVTGIFVPLFAVSGNDFRLINDFNELKKAGQLDLSGPIVFITSAYDHIGTVDNAYMAIFIAGIILCTIAAVGARLRAESILKGLK